MAMKHIAWIVVLSALLSGCARWQAVSHDHGGPRGELYGGTTIEQGTLRVMSFWLLRDSGVSDVSDQVRPDRIESDNPEVLAVRSVDVDHGSDEIAAALVGVRPGHASVLLYVDDEVMGSIGIETTPPESP